VRRLAAITALCACLLPACGGGGDDEDAGPATTVGAGEKLRVAGTEYAFDPENAVVTGGGGRLEIVLENKGSLAHNLKVEQDGRDLGGTPTFQGGRTESGTVELKPGRYEMICTVGNHAELGMVGTLVVK
jgi:plastocyanin